MTGRPPPPLALVVLVLLVAAGGACASNRSASRSAAPAPVVAGPATAYATITVQPRDGAAVEVAPSLRSKVAPLLAARTFGRGGDSGRDYGLDSPVARLVYRPLSGAAAVAVDVGSPTFDGHGVYVRREGQAQVSVVLRDDLAPVLTLVGVDLPAPR